MVETPKHDCMEHLIRPIEPLDIGWTHQCELCGKWIADGKVEEYNENKYTEFKNRDSKKGDK